ncbi:MAG TPA: metal ABC transporter ATP-binding protein [Thermomicrobiales bacterium]|nr:metal ABC transporter ATP-binding protein [Thermomicrobiales bacterium]
MSILKLHDVSVRYGHLLALDSVSIQIPSGAVTGLIGPNGSGKSTLIKTIAGEITSYEGELTWDGQPLDRTRTRIAYVPQAREVNWDFPLSGLDLVLMGRSRAAGWFGRYSAEDRAAALAALERLSCADAAERHISQFSGGQQQRLFLARALVREPEIVLLDEPMTGLDVTTREIIHELIEEFAAGGAAVVMATHDLEKVQALCDRLVCLNRRVIAHGPTSTVFTPEVLRATFGGRVAVFA